jgi:hypothetical protein
MGLRTPQQALDYAVNNLKTGYNDWCLLFVQTAYGAQATQPSAQDAWNNAGEKHSGYPNIPGLPIYFSQAGNPYGHIALWAAPDTMYTTDSSVGHPHYDSISKWVNQYGYKYLGYTTDLENQTIPGVFTLDNGEIMAISDEDAKKIAAAVWQYSWPPAPAEGGNMYNMMARILEFLKRVPADVWQYAWKDGKTGKGAPEGGNMYNEVGNIAARVKKLSGQ